MYLYKKQISSLSLSDVKDAIIADINARTDEKILSGFKYGDNDGVERSVWLSAENQNNYSEANRLANLVGSKKFEAVTFKIGEDEEGRACYKTFGSLDELNEFYFGVFAYIKQCLVDGWLEKDSIDFTPYEAFFPAAENNNASEE